MSTGVIVFPGSNCDRDMLHVLCDVFNLDARFFWHDDPIPEDLDAVILPGGFTYGDRLRSGVIAAHSPAIPRIKKMAQKGTPVLGVCNGFQILVESGMLPGALLKNESSGFMCQWTTLVVKNNRTPFTSKLGSDQSIPIPVANGEGRYYIDDTMLEQLKTNNQIVFEYADSLNGSSDRIAGVCSREGNVVGMMPHPERAAEGQINPTDPAPAALIFESLLDAVEAKK